MSRKTAPTPPPVDDFLTTLELLPIADLRPHPRNTRAHPPAELAHLRQSIQEHTIYRNVVVAQDGTILAGEGVVTAAKAEGYTHIPGKRMPYAPDDPRAIRLLVGDNYIAQLSLNNDEGLTTLLRELQAHDPLALLGTGFDEETLAVLAEQSGVMTPDFQPVGIEEQGRLDQKAPLECPACGHTWVA